MRRSGVWDSLKTHSCRAEPPSGSIQSMFGEPETPISSDRPAFSRRKFLAGATATAALGACATGVEGQTSLPEPTGPNVLGPLPGCSPQVGSFVSLLTWMREANGVLSATKGLKPADLDYLFDANANSMGALMLHLAATET
jgi:hypothetical protein